MNLQKRQFLTRAYKVGGLSALISLGMSYKTASVFASLIQQMHKSVIARKVVEGPGGGGCETAYYSNLGAFTANMDIKDAEPYTYVGAIYVGDSDRELCSVDAYLNGKDTGTQVNNYYMSVWTVQNQSLSAPGNLVAQQGSNSTPGIPGNDDWDDQAPVNFSFSTPISKTANVHYAILLTHDGEASAATEVEWYYDGSSTGIGRGLFSSSGVNNGGGIGGPRMVLYE